MNVRVILQVQGEYLRDCHGNPLALNSLEQKTGHGVSDVYRHVSSEHVKLKEAWYLNPVYNPIVYQFSCSFPLSLCNPNIPLCVSLYSILKP